MLSHRRAGSEYRLIVGGLFSIRTYTGIREGKKVVHCYNPLFSG